MDQDWWRSAVLYQIYPRSFADSNGDGIGDLSGATARLSYLADLGVDGVWISPFFVSPMNDYGYDVADYLNVDPMFGSLADFDALVAEAHRLGLKVIIDQVYSHTSDEHDWFKDSRASRDNPKADWYVWADPKPDGTPPNNWLSVFGGPAWTWDARRRQYYLHNFLSSQPDLNFHEPAVQEAVLDVARFWLDRGVDGFRLDVANYFVHDADLRDNPPTNTSHHARPGQFQQHLYERSQPGSLVFAERLRSLLNSYPDKMSVAEIDSSSPVERSIEYTEGDRRYHTAYSFSLLRAKALTPQLIRKSLEPFSDANAWPSWSISNHDVHRAVTRWGTGGDEIALARQVLALLLALRGTIFLYQGDELGLPQAMIHYTDLLDPESKRFWPEDLGRDGARTPFPWNQGIPHAGFTHGDIPWMQVDDRHKELAADTQAEDPLSVLSFARGFLRLRRNSKAMQLGDIRFFDLPGNTLGFERSYDDERMLFIFNLSAQAISLDTELFPEPVEVVETALLYRLTTNDLDLPPHGGLVARVA